LQLPTLVPETPLDVSLGTTYWQAKVLGANPGWSSPSREQQFVDFNNAVASVQANSTIQQYELEMYKRQREEETTSRQTLRKRLRVVDETPRGLTREHAIQLRDEKARKEAAQAQGKAHRAFIKIWRAERDSVLAQGIIARRKERDRAKIVRELLMDKREVP